MARPRNWEMGVGEVPELTPMYEAFDVYKLGTLDFESYRALYLNGKRNVNRFVGIAPGILRGIPHDLPYQAPSWLVQHNDTLLCCCSKRDAAEGKCHRVWAGGLLLRAGWCVILDGKEMTGVDENWKPIFTEEL